MALDKVDLTLGAVLCGVFASVFMFGIVTFQTYVYFRKFPKDTRFRKSLIGILWCLQIAFSVCVCQAAYAMTITTIKTIPTTVALPATLKCALIIGALIDHGVQAVFILRIYRFTKKLYVAIPLWLLSAFLFATALVAAARSFVTPNIVRIPYGLAWKWLMSVIFVGAAVLDLIIAATLCYFLRKQSRLASKSTAVVVDRLILYTIQTGLVTSMVAIITAVIFHAVPDNYVWIALFICMPGFFANALLAAVNSRKHLQKLSCDVVPSCNTFLAKSDGCELHNGRDSDGPVNLTPHFPPHSAALPAIFSQGGHCCDADETHQPEVVQVKSPSRAECYSA